MRWSQIGEVEMNRLSIKTSLVAMFVAMALMTLGLGAFAMFTMAGLYDNTNQLGTNRIPKVTMISEVSVIFGKLRASAARQLLADTPETIAAEQKTASDLAKSLDDKLRQLDPVFVRDEGRRLVSLIPVEIAKYKSMQDETLIPLRDAGKLPEAKEFLRSTMLQQAEIAEKAIMDLQNYNANGTSAEMSDAAASYNTSFWAMILVVGAAVAAASGAAAFAIIRISTPISRITGSMEGLARGDVASEIPFSTRTDEIGSMASAVEVFRQTALAKIESDRRSEENRSQSEQDRIAREQADRARAEAMVQATKGLASGLKALSSGDLTVQIDQRFAPDFEQLREDFNLAVSQLCATLANVAGATVNIDSGSREIAGGANDLAKRTEQQAAALEETAAALDQITANVRSSSQRADEARHVAVEANQSAAKSGDVVSQAVNAMSRIEESAKQISNIIGVIDEIAFQTNLLALNAGVEAARAGDAGKGFAVVAQEVRELAQRSAQAAKEIKGLIQASTTEVATGVKLVSETGDALKAIGGFIVTINQHMDAIATSAREQSVGLAEVNTAVNQMDQTTQQNAAMVEETSAASGTLASESANLRDMIAQFNLGHAGAQANAGTQALRQTAARMAQPSASARPASSGTPARAPARKVANAGNGAAVAQEWSEF